MKITINAKDLSTALGKVRAVVPGRTTMPILSTFLFNADAGSARVTGSQIDMEAAASAPCEVQEAGTAAISETIFGVVKALGKQTITIDASGDGRAIVAGSRQRYEFGTLNADEFPTMDRINDGVAFEIPAPVLLTGLDVTKNTASTLEAQPHLCGVCICIDGGMLTFVSTDRHRLSRFQVPCPPGADAIGSHIIPSAFVSALVAMLQGDDGAVTVTLSKRAMRVDTASLYAASKLVEGQFVPYKDRMAALPNDLGLRVQASELSEAVGRIIALRAETKAPVITLAPNGSSVDLVSDRRAKNAGRETVEVEVIVPTPEFSVSTGYLAGLLSAWPESAHLDISAPVPGGPITIKSPSVPGLFQLVMPMSA